MSETDDDAVGNAASSLFDSHAADGASHEEICFYAEIIFHRIRQTLIERVVPTTLRSAFLDPIHENTTIDTSIDIFSRSDTEFLELFFGKISLLYDRYVGMVMQCRAP